MKNLLTQWKFEEENQSYYFLAFLLVLLESNWPCFCLTCLLEDQTMGYTINQAIGGTMSTKEDIAIDLSGLSL